MSNLFDINRVQFQKIFEVHQHKGTISYTDSLKICSSLKIFPDLLTSQEIRKIFVALSYSDNGTERMTFLQFESFLKILAKQAFKHHKSTSNDYGLLITHIKENSQKRYGAILENQVSKGRSLSKNIQHRSKKTLSTPKSKVQSSFFKPPSEKALNKTLANKKSPIKLSVNKVSGLISMLSPGLKTLKTRIDTVKYSALTERREGHLSTCSTSPSPNKVQLLSRIGKAFNDFQESCKKVSTEKIVAQRRLEKIFRRSQRMSERLLLMRMAFRVWTLV
ncbi:hypothetical protein SteCoe_24359 [Stentor coeruleus]|uniref:EF-hand domain-containing protein n=1 Tax=Stentor coeruleus TaxID=5963 RepID=A0A1R2BHQ9_9CILI|nr:hypothetical protein SteCoe_24359 [Stentor coeruleus]